MRLKRLHIWGRIRHPNRKMGGARQDLTELCRLTNLGIDIQAREDTVSRLANHSQRIILVGIPMDVVRVEE